MNSFNMCTVCTYSLIANGQLRRFPPSTVSHSILNFDFKCRQKLVISLYIRGTWKSQNAHEETLLKSAQYNLEEKINDKNLLFLATIFKIL